MHISLRSACLLPVAALVLTVPTQLHAANVVAAANASTDTNAIWLSKAYRAI